MDVSVCVSLCTGVSVCLYLYLCVCMFISAFLCICVSDIDECSTHTHICSQVFGSTCRNTIGSYSCTCPSGYTKLPNSVLCSLSGETSKDYYTL